MAFLRREILETETQPVMAVPASAIAYRNDRSLVFGISNGRAIGIPVTEGRQMNGMVEILSALNIGDKIIASPSQTILDGTKVKLAQ